MRERGERGGEGGEEREGGREERRKEGRTGRDYSLCLPLKPQKEVSASCGLQLGKVT